MTKSAIKIERILSTCLILNLISFVLVFIVLFKFVLVLMIGFLLWNGTLLLAWATISDKDGLEKEKVIERFFNITEMVSITVIVINILPYPWIFAQPFEYIFIYLIPSFISYVLVIYLSVSKIKYNKI